MQFHVLEYNIVPKSTYKPKVILQYKCLVTEYPTKNSLFEGRLIFIAQIFMTKSADKSNCT